MLPIRDDNRFRRRVPWLTYILVAVNILVFFLEVAGGESFLVRWAFVPSRFLANPIGDLPTVFTSMFMHAGLLHLGGNMLYLSIFGDNVEDRLGHFKFLLFYLACGIAATFAQFAFTTDSAIPNVGASGAIAGVLGAYLLLFPHSRVAVLVGFSVIPLPALIVIGVWIVLQLFSSIGSISSAGESGGVAYMAHVGGFVAGLVLSLPFRRRAKQLTYRRDDSGRWQPYS